ncbi:hypothetical protein MLD38_003702 [Melastoma candidum]|uniref:Uncharacterized protein n=1 Tax=Melastoma candidum TaxID=119954 RepID=A0ACB9S3K4_9MYRT|nr:hypothetical protein MLD38_003702 [Melastoma candidum]
MLRMSYCDSAVNLMRIEGSLPVVEGHVEVFPAVGGVVLSDVGNAEMLPAVGGVLPDVESAQARLGVGLDQDIEGATWAWLDDGSTSGPQQEPVKEWGAAACDRGCQDEERQGQTTAATQQQN